MITEHEIDHYLAALAQELERRKLVKPARLVIVGGAYMVSHIHNRTMTKDVDILPISFPDTTQSDQQTQAFRAAAKAVARTHHLRQDWINDVVAAFAPPPGPLTLWRDYGTLQVYVPHPSYILALKLLAGRDRDADDIEALCHHLGIDTRDQAQHLVDQYADQNWQHECQLDATLDSLF